MRAAWWWIDRWRGSTAYSDMTAEQQGLYRNLLDEIWARDSSIIPDDPRILANVSGDVKAWKRSGATVLRWMQKVPGGWTHPVAQQEKYQSQRRADKQHAYRTRLQAGNAAGNAAGNWNGNGAGNKPGSLSLSLKSTARTSVVHGGAAPQAPASGVRSRKLYQAKTR